MPDTPDEIERAALADCDAKPLTEADFRRMKRTPQAKIIRRALNLTQEELIARDPEHINHKLNRDTMKMPQ